MAAMIKGYVSDPAFRSLYGFLLDEATDAQRQDWRVEWNDDRVPIACGVLRFGLLVSGSRKKGISLASLQVGTHALDAARRDRREHSILVATADGPLRRALEERGLLGEKGYVIVKDGHLPMLIDYPDVALVWGEGWTGETAAPRWERFMDELVYTFIFPEGRQALPAAAEEAPRPANKSPAPDEISELEGCG